MPCSPWMGVTMGRAFGHSVTITLLKKPDGVSGGPPWARSGTCLRSRLAAFSFRRSRPLMGGRLPVRADRHRRPRALVPAGLSAGLAGMAARCGGGCASIRQHRPGRTSLPRCPLMGKSSSAACFRNLTLHCCARLRAARASRSGGMRYPATAFRPPDWAVCQNSLHHGQRDAAVDDVPADRSPLSASTSSGRIALGAWVSSTTQVSGLPAGFRRQSGPAAEERHDIPVSL